MIEFKNYDGSNTDECTPIPAVIYWLYTKKYGKNPTNPPTALNASFCTFWLAILADFLKKYPDEIHCTKLNTEKEKFYETELKKYINTEV